MAFADIRVKQYKVYENPSDYSTATVVITLDSAVTAGNTLIVVGGSVLTTYADATTLTSVASSPSNTWTSTNQDPGVGAPNAFGAYAVNVASGTTSVTLTLNSSPSGDKLNRVGAVLFEIENVVTTSLLDGSTPTKATESTASDTSYTTGNYATLSQTDCLLIGVATGGFNPSNPSGWTNYLLRSNGSPYVGCIVSVKKVTVTTADAFTVSHVSTSNYRSGMVYALKAKTAAAVQYEFTLDSNLTAADTGITGYVWRNGAPNAVLAEVYTGLAGNASNKIIVTGVPGGATTGDTITGQFSNSTDTSGLVTGTVVTS